MTMDLNLRSNLGCHFMRDTSQNAAQVLKGKMSVFFGLLNPPRDLTSQFWSRIQPNLDPFLI